MQTSKNAVLPIMAACIMCDGVSILIDYPKITDVDSMVDLMRLMGAKIDKQENALFIDPTYIEYKNIDEKLASRFRSSIFLLGALITKCKKAIVVPPGGCDIGARAIDIHLKGLEKLGVNIIKKGDALYCDASKLKSGDLFLPFSSVGATENLIMASVKIDGITNIYNCAREPEIVDLCNALNKMGAKIQGAGSSVISITGVKTLRAIEYKPIPDRIATGTFLVACAMCRGDITIKNTNHNLLKNPIQLLKNMGAAIKSDREKINIKVDRRLNNISKIFTFAYPYFPTDLQSQFLALACIGNGVSLIEENLFENRFLIVEDLKNMNANITMSSNYCIVEGKSRLREADVYATDLRAGASIVLATLSVNGLSTISNIHYIDRGYESFEKSLLHLGADIKRIK